MNFLLFLAYWEGGQHSIHIHTGQKLAGVRNHCPVQMEFSSTSPHTLYCPLILQGIIINTEQEI